MSTPPKKKRRVGIEVERPSLSTSEASPPSRASSSSPFAGLVSPSPERQSAECAGRGTDDDGDGPCDTGIGLDTSDVVEPIFLGICQIPILAEAGHSVDERSAQAEPGELEALKKFGFAALLLPPQGVSERATAEALASALSGGHSNAPHVVEINAIGIEGGKPVERFFPLLQQIYSERCVAGEESCLIGLRGHAHALEGLTALGRWFLGREPTVEPSHLVAGGQRSYVPMMWAAVDLVGFRLAGCSSHLRFEQKAHSTEATEDRNAGT